MIDIYAQEIETCLLNQCYFSALALTLTLPDICGIVEYPELDERQVKDRYIGWYDKYVGDAIDDMNGETVYNLRNYFLHKGSPSVDPSFYKDKENSDNIDIFDLQLNDEKIWTATISISIGQVKAHLIRVNVSFMCRVIYNSALSFYRENIDNFHFDYHISSDENYIFFNRIRRSEDELGEIINRKLIANGKRPLRGINVTQTVCENLKNIPPEQLKKLVDEINAHIKERKNSSKPLMSKEEQNLRSYFGRECKEKQFQNKKKEIIPIILDSRTESELEKKLRVILPDEDVSLLIKELKSWTRKWSKS